MSAQVQGGPVDLIGEAREKLTAFMLANFKDRTFTNYITNRLAGDFAFEMARAIEQHILASKSAAPVVASDVAAGVAVAVVDEGDEGLFVEILQGSNGTSLKRGDILYASAGAPVQPTSEPAQGASIDTPEFRQLLGDFRKVSTSAAWNWSTSHANKIIAHITAWHASQIAAALSEGRKQGAARSAATYSEYIARQSASVEDASRLLKAAKVYAFNYCQDEAESEEDCVCGPKQHAEAIELFAAIAAMTKAAKKGGA